MKRLVFALLLIALPLAAQEAKKEDEKITAQPAAPSVQKLFLLKYADPAKVADLLRVFNASVSLNSDMHALAVKTTPGPSMAAIEEAIQRLDVPSAASKNIEMTAYLLIGGKTAGTEPSAMPKELDSVMAQTQERIRIQELSLAGYPGAAHAGWAACINQQCGPPDADRN